VSRREGADPPFEAVVQQDPPTVLHAEWLRDGRIALGTRHQNRDGKWEAGELHLLEPPVALDLAAWLTPVVLDGWIDSVRERLGEPLQTARELYGEGTAAAERLALEMLREIPPELLVRSLILLANSLGPENRERLVQQLNRTTSRMEDAALRRRLADEHEAFAYAVAASALFDALARGVIEDESEPE
jgi:hypothetical protein